jgi:effector-binding domain-containing protein
LVVIADNLESLSEGTGMTSKLVAVVAFCALLSTSVWAQTPAREIALGTRTTAAMNVVYVERECTVTDLLKQFSEAGIELGKNAEAAGFHSLGNVILTLTLDAEPGPDQLIKWECWIPVAEKPVAEDLDKTAKLKVKSIPEEHVAYTYHVGEGSPETTFAQLYMWALGQGMQLSGEVRGIVTFLPPREGDNTSRYVIEAQVVVL